MVPAAFARERIRERGDPDKPMSAGTPREEAAVIALVSGAHGFSHYYIFGLPTILAFMVKDPSLAHLELNFVKAGLVVSAFSLSSGAFQFLVGVLADRIGAKPVLFGGLTLLAGSFALLGFADTFPLMLLLAFTAGMGNSVFHPVDYAIIGANISTPRLARAFSIPTLSGYLGFAVGPFVSGVLFSVAAVFAALGHRAAAALLTRRSPRVLITWSSLATAAGLVLLIAVPSVLAFAVALAIAGVAIGIGMTAAFTSGGALLPPDAHATGFGLMMTASLIGLAASPIVAGLISGPELAIVFDADVVLLVVLALAVWAGMRDDPPPAPPAG